MDKIEMLLKKNADVNSQGQYDWTPLHLAAKVSNKHNKHIQYIYMQYINCFMLISFTPKNTDAMLMV